MPLAPTLTLLGGTSIPQVALGTWPMRDEEVERACRTAFEVGYRHVDTAENYENEVGVGRAVRGAGIPRDELFVTTKINRQWHGAPADGLAGNLRRLGLDHVDLVLLHWPNPDQDLYVHAWEGLITLREQGLARAIGVSNFKPAHLDRLIGATGVAPEVNQVELHPYLTRDATRAYHEAHGIVTEGWSPLGRGTDLLDNEVVTRVARDHDVTPGQVLLRWQTQQGHVVAPKSSDPRRQARNLDVFGFDLTPGELEALHALDTGETNAVDSDTFGH
jgi:2,5-diketo-D-gluconate reductase A